MRARPLARYLAGIAALALAYFGGAWVGQGVAPAPLDITPVWPPAGIALGVLLLFGSRFWPGIVLGEIAASLTVGMPLLPALAFAGLNTLQALLAAWVLRRVFSFRAPMERARDVLALALVASGITMLGAAVGTGVHLLLGDTAPGAAGGVFVTWWLSDAMGVMLLAPVLLTWGTRWRIGTTPWRLAESAVLTVFLTIVTLAVFTNRLDHPYLIAPALVWAALRFGQRGTATAVLLVSALGILATGNGLGPFVRPEAVASLLSLQAFLAVVAVTALLLAATLAERQSAREELERTLGGLELRVQERTRELETANAALRESERTVRAILDAPADIAMLVDPQGTILAANHHAAAWWGRTPESMAGTVAFDLFPPEVAALRRALGEEALRGRKPLHAEETREGRQFEVTYYPIIDSEGNAARLAVIARDVTDQRHAEETLRLAQTQWSQFLEASPDPMWIKDAQGRYVAVNNALLRLWGLHHVEVVGRTDRDVWPARATAFAERDAAAIRDGSFNGEVSEALDGDSRTFAVSIVRLVATDGRVAGTLALGRDISERKRTEEALRESEVRYRTLFDSSNDAIFLMRDEAFVDCNDRASAMLGSAKGDIIGRTPVDFSPAEQPGIGPTAGAFSAKLDAALAGGTRLFDWVCRRRDGTAFDAEVSVRRLELGGRPHLQAVMRDVSDRKAVEALHQRYAALSENAHDIIMFVRPEGRIVEANRAAVTAYGYTREELLRLNVLDLRASEPPVTLQQQVELAPEGGFLFELIQRRKDGTTFPAEVSTRLIDLGGEPILLGVIRDISERKRTEDLLRRSEEQYRGLVESANESICISQDGFLRLVNPRMSRFTGLTEAELKARPFLEFIHPEDRDRVRSYAERRAQGLEAPTEFELRVVTKDGDVRWAVTKSTQVTWDGRPATLSFLSDITERKEAERALEASEARFRATFEGAAMGIAVCDMNGRILAANQTLEAMLGYSAGEAEGRNVADVTYPADALKDAAETRQLVAGSLDHYQVEKRYLRKDGSVLWGRLTVSLVRGQDGRPELVIGMVEDIAERRRAEDAVQQEKALTDAVIESMPGMFYLLDRQGRFVRWNQFGGEVSGLTPEETRGADPLMAVHPDDRAPVAQTMGEIFRTGQGATEARLVNRKTGALHHVLLTGRKIEIGGEVYLVGNGIEITERKHYEEALLESERKFRALVENSPDIIARFDRALRHLYISPAITGITGVETQEFIGRTVRELGIPDELAERLEGGVLEVFETGEKLSFHVNVPTRLGMRHLDFRLIPEKSPDGTVESVLSVASDVTDRKHIEEQLVHAQKMEAVGNLAGGVAHDFNNLLQALLTSVEMLHVRRNDRAAFATAVTEIQEQIRHGASLSRQLLLFARRELSQRQALDLNEVVRAASALMRRLLRENIRFVVELAPEPLPLAADRGQLEQVLVNLVVNASDAMQSGGRITVQTGRLDRDWLTFEVADTGSGMAEEVKRHIFEPFFTTKEATKGTGLGLAVVHGIVTAHGGRIDVESEPGRGTTFRVVLPSGASPAVSAPERPAEALPEGRGERLLLVEDERNAREGLHAILTMLGYGVVTAESGEEAVGLPGEPRFDILLTDLLLPGIHGGELADALRARWPALKVILMSGYTEDETVRRGVRTGAVRFLQKPFDMVTLAREVRDALDD